MGTTCFVTPVAQRRRVRVVTPPATPRNPPEALLNPPKPPLSPPQKPKALNL